MNKENNKLGRGLGALLNTKAQNKNNINKIDISKIAQASNYKIFTSNTKKSLEEIIKKLKKINGPVMIVIRISRSKEKSSRVDITPEKIKLRFMSAINW